MMGEIQTDHPLAVALGFTADRFDGYLWLAEKNSLYVSFVDAKHPGRGHFRAFIEKALTMGFTVKVPTPIGRMEGIVRRWGFEHIVEPSEMGPCDVWVKKGPLPTKEETREQTQRQAD